MSGVLQLGPFVIRLDLLYYGLSVLLGFTLGKRFLKGRMEASLPCLDIMVNALFVGLIIWKLSPVLSEPSLLRYPLSILVLPGTGLGVKLACAGAFMYVVYALRRQKRNWRLMMDVIAVVFVISVSVFLLSHWQYGTPTKLPWGISVQDPAYRYHPVNAYQMILMVPVLAVMYRCPIGNGKMASAAFIGYGSSSLLVSILQPKLPVMMNLSANQLIALFLVVVGVIMMNPAPPRPQDDTSKEPKPS